ncbi:MAG: CpXC domain-containing protein [Sulfitobacter sp.]
MSLFSNSALSCPTCETVTEFQAAGSVNADRRSDLRNAILQNSFQSASCPSCGERMRLEPRFNYLDMEFGIWMAAHPARQLADVAEAEAEVQALFDTSYGVNASDTAQQVGADLRPRLTFGWPAAREKILLFQAGLDDVAIEMLKLDLLRRLPQAPLRPGVDLRVVEIAEQQLGFVWIENDTEAVLEGFEAHCDMLSEIEQNASDWADIRAHLTSGVFVDMQRLLLQPAE